MILYGCFPFNLTKITAPRAYRLQKTKDSGVWGGGSLRTFARSALAFSIEDALGARALPFSNATRVLPTFLFHFVHHQQHISSLSPLAK